MCCSAGEKFSILLAVQEACFIVLEGLSFYFITFTVFYIEDLYLKAGIIRATLI